MRGRGRGLKREGEGLINILPLKRGGLLERGGLNREFTVFYWRRLSPLPVEKWYLDSAIRRIKIYPVDNAIDFPNTYQQDSDLSGR